MSSVTIWNRIEPRCRALDLAPGLEARVHDPLWLLARQWQVGEYEGRDTGSPVSATVESTIAPLDRCSVGTESAQAYDNRQPIEALVEREAVRPSSAAGDLRQATEAGLYFVRLLDAAHMPPAIAAAYLAQYPLSTPSRVGGDAQPIAAIVAGRVIDGIKLHADLVSAGTNLPPLPAIPAAQRDAVLRVTRDWLAWYGALFSEPRQGDGWSPDRMEYRFAMGAAGDAASYTAREYDGGAVDWYTFDRSSKVLSGGTAQPSTVTQRTVATPVVFRGMPARRFWELEDAGANIGLLSAAAEDLGRLLLREFALVYGNDWFQFPLVVPVGSHVAIRSLSVADTFGITTPIPHYSDVDGGAGRWQMFAFTPDAPAPNPPSGSGVSHPLLISPNAVAPLDSAAIEDVLLLRDELANMAWGIERTVYGVSGQPVDRTLAWRTSALPAPPVADDAVPGYRLGSTVPDYWLPFLPVVVNPGGPLQLRRGRLPTSAAGPMGRMLAYPGLTLFLEEVPREGARLERRYRSARGPDGSSYLWVGRRRSTGRGEGRSGLRFDFLE